MVLTYFPSEFKMRTEPHAPRTMMNPIMSEVTASRIFYFRFNFFTVFIMPFSHSQILRHFDSTDTVLRT